MAFGGAMVAAIRDDRKRDSDPVSSPAAMVYT